YWIEKVKDGALGRADHGPLAKKPDVAEWFYLPSWTRSAPLGLSQGADPSALASRWLVFADAHGIGSRLAERLEQAGQDVTVVMPGEGFARLNDRAYTLDPRQAEDYKALLKDLHAQDRNPAKVAHLWSVTAQHPALTGEES